MKDFSPSLYDIAVASLVNGPHQPAHLNWLFTHQNHDGSWGAPYEVSGYDNYISTYAAAVALRNADHPLAESAFKLLSSRELWDVEKNPETLTFGGLIDVLDKYCRYRLSSPLSATNRSSGTAWSSGPVSMTRLFLSPGIVASAFSGMTGSIWGAS
jgi:hypothetical protein